VVKLVALLFEVYGAFCFFSMIAFLVWAAVAKLRPDLDEEEFDLAELEKLKQLVSSEWPGEALSIEPPIIEEPSWSRPARWAEQSGRPIRRRRYLFHTRNPRTI
jgi:hypothetical protein